MNELLGGGCKHNLGEHLEMEIYFSTSDIRG
jgi:hypothetical protein